MKILADESIPLLDEFFGAGNTLTTFEGRTLTATDCKDQDILLVRSVTRVDADLLQNSSIHFVGSATTGSDHLDTAWLDQAGIRWATAAGCNTKAVQNYFVCTLAALQEMNFLTDSHPTAAVIGAGRIGEQVAETLKYLGFQTLICDPFRKDPDIIPLHTLQNSDLITLHTPLTQDGPHPTFHLIDRNILSHQKQRTILVNTARGATVFSDDLKIYGQKLLWCLDVFENEPFPDPAIVDGCLLATPHIAGHTLDAKWRGTKMLQQAALQLGIKDIHAISLPAFPHITLSFGGQKASWRDVVLQTFDPRMATHEMKTTLRYFPDQFDRLRRQFPTRHEFESVIVSDVQLSERDRHILEYLGFSVRC